MMSLADVSWRRGSARWQFVVLVVIFITLLRPIIYVGTSKISELALINLPISPLLMKALSSMQLLYTN